MSDAPFVTIYRAQGMLEAQVIKSKLESASIPVLLRYEAAGLVLGITVDGLGLVEVQTLPEWTEAAEDILAPSE